MKALLTKNYRYSFSAISFILFVLISFLYFSQFGNYVFFFLEQQFLFIFSNDYITMYLTKPGGIIELTGNFITKFCDNVFWGACIITIILIIPALIILKINKFLLNDQSFSQFTALVPSCLLLLMQTHYYHQITYNLGYIIVLLYFLFSILLLKRQNLFFIIICFPLFYYIAGGFIWIYLIMYVSYILLNSENNFRIKISALTLIVAGVTFFVFRNFLFLQPVKQFFLNPLPLIKDTKHSIFFYFLTGYIALYPLIIKLIPTLPTSKKVHKVIFPYILIVITYMGLGITLYKLYDPQTKLVLQLEKYTIEKEWKKTINLHETSFSRNMLGQYFYNISLSETGQLCERIFNGEQDFGPRSLILPWNQKHINRGAYFYYTLGLTNEAHRWAYESMVIYGYRPDNIKMLIKTSLINEDYRMAKKYINILKKSLNYRKYAIEYEKMLYEPQKIKSHPELGAKLKLLPKTNFFINLKEPENNINMALNSNFNKVAFEYEMAWLLLSKNVDSIVNNVYKIRKLGYNNIPRHIEEAILVYYNMTREVPNLYGFTISKKNQMLFNQYISDYTKYRNNSKLLKKNMHQKFGNTFWYYYHFK